MKMPRTTLETMGSLPKIQPLWTGINAERADLVSAIDWYLSILMSCNQIKKDMPD